MDDVESMLGLVRNMKKQANFPKLVSRTDNPKRHGSTERPFDEREVEQIPDDIVARTKASHITARDRETIDRLIYLARAAKLRAQGEWDEESFADAMQGYWRY